MYSRINKFVINKHEINQLKITFAIIDVVLETYYFNGKIKVRHTALC